MSRCIVPWFAALAVFLASGTSWAQDAKPDSTAEALAAYEAGEFERAAGLFERAFQKNGEYGALFGWAQSERQLGNCAEARALYQKVFVHPDLPTEAANKVKLAMEQDCTQRKVEPKTAPDKPTPEKTVPEKTAPGKTAPEKAAPDIGASSDAADPPRSIVVDRRPWYTDVLGDVLLGAGALSLAVGGVQLAQSFGTEDSIAGLSSLPMQNDRFAKAERERAIGIGGLALGGALVVGAVVRYATRDETRTRTRSRMVVWSPGRGIAAGYMGRF